jgi:hypothetical protein
MNWFEPVTPVEPVSPAPPAPSPRWPTQDDLDKAVDQHEQSVPTQVFPAIRDEDTQVIPVLRSAADTAYRDRLIANLRRLDGPPDR